MQLNNTKLLLKLWEACLIRFFTFSSLPRLCITHESRYKDIVHLISADPGIWIVGERLVFRTYKHPPAFHGNRLFDLSRTIPQNLGRQIWRRVTNIGYSFKCLWFFCNPPTGRVKGILIFRSRQRKARIIEASEIQTLQFDKFCELGCELCLLENHQELTSQCLWTKVTYHCQRMQRYTMKALFYEIWRSPDDWMDIVVCETYSSLFHSPIFVEYSVQCFIRHTSLVPPKDTTFFRPVLVDLETGKIG